jgi:hypothetical protein
LFGGNKKKKPFPPNARRWLRPSRLARRLTVENKNKINPTAIGAEPGA